MFTSRQSRASRGLADRALFLGSTAEGDLEPSEVC